MDNYDSKEHYDMYINDYDICSNRMFMVAMATRGNHELALPSPIGERLEISGIASQFAIQNARFAIHNKLMHSKIANHLKNNCADI